MAITPSKAQALAPKVSTSSVDTFFSNVGSIGDQQPVDTTIIERGTTNDNTRNVEQSPQQMGNHSHADTFESVRPQNQLHASPRNGVIVPSSGPNTSTAPEFLYQLTKMLTDNNRDIIEWSNGEPFIERAPVTEIILFNALTHHNFQARSKFITLTSYKHMF